MLDRPDRSLDVVIALHQRPEGARLTHLLSAVAARARPIETSLRRLVALGLVEREPSRHPRYRLVAGHPAARELAALALRMPEPMHALSVAVKSSPAVWYAAADPDEFMIVHHDDSPDAALDTLEQAIGLVGARDRAMPRIVRFSRGEFLRLLRVGVAFRVRALALEPIKGRLLDRPMAAGPAG